MSPIAHPHSEACMLPVKEHNALLSKQYGAFTEIPLQLDLRNRNRSAFLPV